jgi:hypothetical protein
MLRSNLSARADARAWAAVLLPLLILTSHAWANKAINLSVHHSGIYQSWRHLGCHLARSPARDAVCSGRLHGNSSRNFLTRAVVTLGERLGSRTMCKPFRTSVTSGRSAA